MEHISEYTNEYIKATNGIMEFDMKDLAVLAGNQVKTTETGYAKINLALDVTGRLDNGYHLVKMIMESISLHDELSFTCTSNPGIRMTCSRDDLSCGDDNLVVRSARAVLDKVKELKPEIADRLENFGLDIHLQKNIPMAAGMAGGSTDAAAVFRALNRMLDLGLSVDELCEMGVKLGADIPYCIRGGSYLSEGIGEVLTEIPNPPGAYIAVIKPDIDVSTKYVYEHLDTEGVRVHPDVDGMIEALKCSDLKGVTDRLGNVLRDVTVNKYQIVLELEEFLKANGAMNALMSGSGPTVFGIYDDEKRCAEAVSLAHTRYPDMFAEIATFVY